jgi:1-acyl-sn-glycerol-3-phosphate acyltransferase
MNRLWGFVRGVGRLLALLLVLLGSMLTYALDRRNRRDAVTKALWLQLVCRRLLSVLAISVESRGVPARGAVIVSNHLSYVDIVILAATTPVVFVSKKEVLDWPFFGWFAEKAGTRFIDRNTRSDVKRIAEEIGPVMRADLTVVLFLEGTTTDGSSVLPFRSSLLEPAVLQQWKIVPTALSYRVPFGRSAGQEVCWWGDMTLMPHLFNFATLPWICASVYWGEELISADNRKLLAEELHRRVMALKERLASSCES